MTNILFPGRPEYTGPTAGMFGLLHHDMLVESSHDVTERVAYVRDSKPAHELAIRLHNMIYLGGCPEAVEYDAKRAVILEEYRARHAPIWEEYDAKHAALRPPILAYILRHIPDCAWDGEKLVFPEVTT